MTVRCRQIRPDDLDAVAQILCRGFTNRDPAYWHRGFIRHRESGPPPGYPIYGFLLEAGDRIVGVLLTLHSLARYGTEDYVKCNLSSWYVDPEYRSYGPLLDKMATRAPEVTYLNVTPAPHTWQMLETLQYRRYCLGQMLSIPVLSRRRRSSSLRRIEVQDSLADLSDADRRLVRAHIGYGCLALVCTDGEGARPMLFQRRTIGFVPNLKSFGQIPAAQLIYARHPEDLVLFAASIGLVLLKAFGTPLLVLDADQHVRGLPGRFFSGRAPKYQRGRAPVRLGDLADTELVLFGP